jgi:putative membrane protein
VLSVARLVERALDRNRPATLTFLVSLMVGALRLPAREVSAAAGGPAAYGPAVVAALAGAVIVGLLEYYTQSVGFQ